MNRLDVSIEGRELQFKLAPGQVTGNNFAAAVQMINHEINKRLGIGAGERGRLRSQDYKQAMDAMDDIVNILTRRLMKTKDNDHEEKR